MVSETRNPFGTPIYSYTRTQAIEDGVLVDLTQFETVRQHWKLHMACTDTVWSGIEDAVHQHGKDFEGILHDISTMAKIAINKSHGTDTLLFTVIIGNAHKNLKLVIGPGDDATPVLTLMLPHED
jgi:type I site-specific restriction-modification system R (restriction) subunit